MTTHRLHPIVLVAAVATAAVALLSSCVALPPPPPSSSAAPTATPPAAQSSSPAPTAGAAEGPVSSGVAQPPSTSDDDLSPEEWAVLEVRSLGSYDIYLEMRSGMSGDAVSDRALMEQVATPEHVTRVIDQHRMLREAGVQLDGSVHIGVFEMLTDAGRITAHVCNDLEDVRVVDIASGQPREDAVVNGELLVEFALMPDGRFVVANEVEVLEHERTCS